MNKYMNKYIKYKLKYLELNQNKQSGGSSSYPTTPEHNSRSIVGIREAGEELRETPEVNFLPVTPIRDIEEEEEAEPEPEAPREPAQQQPEAEAEEAPDAEAEAEEAPDAEAEQQARLLKVFIEEEDEILLQILLKILQEPEKPIQEIEVLEQYMEDYENMNIPSINDSIKRIRETLYKENDDSLNSNITIMNNIEENSYIITEFYFIGYIVRLYKDITAELSPDTVNKLDELVKFCLNN